MDYKKTTAPVSTITRDVTDFSKGENVYEVLNVLAKRADQIGSELKQELNSKLEEFASSTDNLEEIFENREQIEISKFYEKLPKPGLIAQEEWVNDEIYYRNPNKVVVEKETEKE
ncbi:MAG: ferritin-like metal-binding protein YciE [Flavobacteriales bacterium]|jgi:ferritin-like metal-binding protein YciE|tara:strand:- start:2316 stop:2660 length:345 start_codon:yes stop_codon:yes gene_type:complete